MKNGFKSRKEYCGYRIFGMDEDSKPSCRYMPPNNSIFDYFTTTECNYQNCPFKHEV